MASFDHPCEIIYWEINKKNNTSGYKMEDYLTCKDQFGDTKLIRKAEKYKKEAADRLAEIQAKVEESAAVARGERSGKIIQHFNMEEMMSKQINGAAYAAFVGFSDGFGGIEKANEIEPKTVCTQMGFDDAVSSTKSGRLSAGNRSQLRDQEDLPEAIFGVVKEKGLFASAKPRTFTINKDRPSRNARIFFEYYTSIACERTIKPGETVQDFDIDIDRIMAAVEREVAAPKLDDDVKRILSLGPEIANNARKSSEESIEGERYEEWEPNIGGDDFFVVQPK
jgi:hypothetical protein